MEQVIIQTTVDIQDQALAFYILYVERHLFRTKKNKASKRRITCHSVRGTITVIVKEHIILGKNQWKVTSKDID
jgi:hypothetical protein